MGLFSGKSIPVVGIDVSSTAVKLLELSRHGDRYRVEAYAVEPLPPNAVVEKNITEVEAVGETIRRVGKRAQTKNKLCAMAVPGSAVITKVISMPANLSDTELVGQIELEADQYIPYSLEEVNLDFEEIGPSQSDPDRIDVLLAASRSENVDARVAAASIGEVNCKIIDVEAFALENAFSLIARELPTGGAGETIALVDIGATMTTLSVLQDLKIIYAREQVFGGKQLTEEIQRRYGLSYEEAGLAKRQGGLPDNYVPEVLEPFKESMAQQVNRALQFFYSSSQITQVDRIVLAGGCASVQGADEVIAAKTGVEVGAGTPLAQMSRAAGGRSEGHPKDGRSLMIACGLAMRTAY